MVTKLFLPDLLNTGPLSSRLMAVRDGPVNFYILKARSGLLCVDTGWRPSLVAHGFETLGLNIRDVAMVLLTHLHWDHAGCLSLFPHAEILVGKGEAASVLKEPAKPGQPWRRVEDGQKAAAADFTVQVIETPGHTSGSVSYVVNGDLLFTGDTICLRRGKVFPFPWFNQDNETLKQSIHKLAGIKGIACLLTAHSGISSDLQNAFSKWRTADDALPEGGGKS